MQLKKLIKLKVPANSTLIKKLFGDSNDLQLQLDDIEINKIIHELGSKITPIEVPFRFRPLQFDLKTGLEKDLDKQQKDLQDQIKLIQNEGKSLNIDIPVTLSIPQGNDFKGILKSIDDLNSANKKLKEDFGVGLPENLARTQHAFQQAAANAEGLLTAANGLTDFINNTAVGAFESLGEAIGTALSGQNANIFGAILETMGEGLKTLGETMIKAGVEMLAIKLAFNSLNPVLAIAAGVALEALGSLVASKAPKLATGGIIPPGYPNDSFPALLSSNEAVIPLDKGLGNYMNNSNEPIVIIPEVRLSGNDIFLSYNRTSRKNKRSY
jgi:hypothetical protein